MRMEPGSLVGDSTEVCSKVITKEVTVTLIPTPSTRSGVSV